MEAREGAGMQYLMGVCLAYAILFLLIGAVAMTCVALMAVRALVRRAMRQRRK